MFEQGALDDFEVKFLFGAIDCQVPRDDAKMQLALKLSRDVFVGRTRIHTATEDRSVPKAFVQQCVSACNSAFARIDKGFEEAVRLVVPWINDEELSPMSLTQTDNAKLDKADGSSVRNDATRVVADSARLARADGVASSIADVQPLLGLSEAKPQILPNKSQNGIKKRASFKCVSCDKRFRSVLYLEQHQKFHSAERRHQCDTCGWRFMTEEILRRHKLLHAPNKCFECDVCGKQFSQAAPLINHKWTHSAERRFKCDRCYSRFSRPSSLYNHKACHDRMDDLHAVKAESKSEA